LDSDQLSHRTRPTICVIAAVVSLLLVRRAQAHENGLLTPSDLWTHWNWDAALVVGLCLTVGFYAYGVSTLWTRAGRGRGVQQRQVAVFSAGMLVVAMALLSPRIWRSISC
jgi:hypothetical protein